MNHPVSPRTFTRPMSPVRGVSTTVIFHLFHPKPVDHTVHLGTLKGRQSELGTCLVDCKVPEVDCVSHLFEKFLILLVVLHFFTLKSRSSATASWSESCRLRACSSSRAVVRTSMSSRSPCWFSSADFNLLDSWASLPLRPPRLRLSCVSSASASVAMTSTR